MNQPLRSTSAASLVVLASMIAGCAGPEARMGAATHFGGKADMDVGLATRALAALNSNNVPMAIDLAERAVAKSPQDAGFRALLGNAYFASGRFHSAEQAYGDALTIYPNQPQVVLKMALVQIAQGRNERAVAFLNANRSVLDPSNYGLALALAGRPADAIDVLQPAARQQSADATVRQNLALAYAFAGDWTNARTVAAQDVPAGQLDTRIQQWMKLATPAHASDQVAALTGVTPAALDAGQPVQLALTKSDTRQAVAEVPAPAPKKVSQAAPASLQPATPPPAFAEAVSTASAPAPVVAIAPAPPPARTTLASLAASAVSEAKAVIASVLPHSEAPVAKPRRAVAQAAAPKGNSSVVVQLGAYGSPERVLTAWDGAARKFSALKDYPPMSARFASPKGTFYRLSVRGFNSVAEAKTMCASLRREGGTCFVRNFAGDQPVQYAAR
jgi:D-alanyl-D-alanine carboxypeptidase